MAHEHILPILVHVRPGLSLLHDVKLEEGTIIVTLFDNRITFGSILRSTTTMTMMMRRHADREKSWGTNRDRGGLAFARALSLWSAWGVAGSGSVFKNALAVVYQMVKNPPYTVEVACFTLYRPSTFCIG